MLFRSYDYVSSAGDQGSLTSLDITSFCGGSISNCTLTPSIAAGSFTHGFYKADGDLTLNNISAFTSNVGNYVVLVNGNLLINKNITVNAGSTATFVVRGNTTIDKSVTILQGFFSTDQNFTVNGAGTCPGAADLPLNISGAVVVRAGLSGVFTNQRDLCDNTNPSVKFLERPDMILNAPRLLKQADKIWRELAP